MRIQMPFLSIIFTCISLFVWVFSPFIVLAQTASTSTQTVQSVQDQENALQAQLEELETEINQDTAQLATQQGQSASLQRDIGILTTEINQDKLEIQDDTLTIQQLSGQITQKNQTISTLQSEINQSDDSLAQIVRATREYDDSSIINVILSSSSLSSFYQDLDSFGSLERSMKVSLDTIQSDQSQAQIQENDLTQKQNAELDAKAKLQEAQYEVQQSQTQQKSLLSISQNKEKQYQAVLADREAKAAQIRSALFGLRDSVSISFGDALKYAQTAEQKTNVDPAFLLAILTQESNLGANVGTCYLKNSTTGAGVNVNTNATITNVMKPGRDIPPFLTITSSLSKDPYNTRVSCPIAGGGYGGAMGPSQFIPSTWVLFESRITQATGDTTPDPWSPEDAFMASALYLSDLGAGAQTYTSELNAACKYYSGRACDSHSPPNRFYGSAVMAKATQIQHTMIDPLQGL